MTDDTLFPAGEATPGQAQSRKAYQENLDSLKGFDWWQDYLELTRRGWDWRKAIYIAWSAAPSATRIPVTQEELALTVLGLASDRVIGTWRKRNPEMDDEIARMQAAPLLRHRREIYDALVTCASDPDPKSHQDRKLALEMLGDYKPRHEVTGANGGPVRTEQTVKHDLSKLTVDELMALRAIVAKAAPDAVASTG